jgi:hypothetical protein
MATKLVTAGKNPDAAPFILFIFDAVAAMCGNLLFLSASNVYSVFSMIAVDVIENISLAIRVILLVQKSHDIGLDRKFAQKEEEMRVVKEELRGLRDVKSVAIDIVHNWKDRDAIIDISALEESSTLLLEGGGDVTTDAEEGGAEALLMHRAMRLLLSFLASEISEIATSLWAMILLPTLYYCSNKQWMYTIDEFTHDDFVKALAYSALDGFLEAVTFVSMLVFVQVTGKLDVFSVGIVYAKRMQIRLPALTASVTIVLATAAFFLKHNGVDPLFDFDVSKFAAAANATNTASSAP